MAELRKYSRVEESLPIKLSSPEFDIVTETKNISGNGAYCFVNKPLEVMSKLRITMLVSLKKAKNKVVKKINCSGVVVRRNYVKDNGKHPYSIGIYFNNIEEENRKILLSYLNSSSKRTAESTSSSLK